MFVSTNYHFVKISYHSRERVSTVNVFMKQSVVSVLQCVRLVHTSDFAIKCARFVAQPLFPLLGNLLGCFLLAEQRVKHFAHSNAKFFKSPLSVDHSKHLRFKYADLLVSWSVGWSFCVLQGFCFHTRFGEQ